LHKHFFLESNLQPAGISKLGRPDQQNGLGADVTAPQSSAGDKFNMNNIK